MQETRGALGFPRTCECDVGDSLILVASPDVGVASWKPNLPKVGGLAVLR